MTPSTSSTRAALKAWWRNLGRNRLRRIERDGHGGRATYVGNNRLLTKCVVRDSLIAFLLEADDLLLTPWFVVSGHFETDLTGFFVDHLAKDSRCIDAGANFGYFTCLMARFCPDGRVIGIEPNRHVFELVRDNLAINGFHHGRAVHAAAGDRAGEVTLYRRHGRSGNTSILCADEAFTDLMGEPPAIPFTVGMVRIDDLVDQQFDGRLDFIKIDVEGAEPLVLAGAERTIAANPQLAIVMEWAPTQIAGAGTDLRSFLDRLAALGLAPFDLKGGLRPITFDELLGLPYRAGVLFKRPPSGRA